MQTFEFTPIKRSDFALVFRWLSAPHVARWWHDDASPERAGFTRVAGGELEPDNPADSRQHHIYAAGPVFGLA
ncbi:acetyltransferase [Massilia glaciei]|uniref:Acetyltransferase n=1 Tax=Massilia glaciei TaxID=1524097 RepID=A0A2U2HET9_9BURK|nr:acetyltransferase [Massilia glaciei]PWF42423.1 acetyltransferase [Massilia glaciei]